MNDVDNRVLLAFKIILFYIHTLNLVSCLTKAPSRVVILFLKARYDLMTLAVIYIQ
jgi:hypothetical protein